MSYHYDKKKKQRRRWYLGGATFFIIALFTPLYGWLFNVVEKPLARSWENKNEFFDGTENFFQSWYGKTKLIEKNKELEQALKRLEIDNLRVEYLSSELEKINHLQTQDNSLQPAQVLSRGGLGAQDTMVISQGSEHGVTIGNKVFAHNNTLLGYVSDVYDVTSRITLYSKNEENIDGILFPHNVSLQTQGYGNGSFLIEAPREIEVVQGDILYSEGQPGAIIAIVRDVRFDPRDPYKQVFLSYPLATNEIHTVGIKK